MMKHPHAQALELLYSDFTRGDYAAMLSHCAEQVTFQVPGKSRLAGKYTKANFVQDFATRLRELSGGTYQLEVHDILASDQHGIVLGTNRVTRSGKVIEFRGVHVWRFENGKPVAGYEYPRDLYQFDQIWS